MAYERRVVMKNLLLVAAAIGTVGATDISRPAAPATVPTSFKVPFKVGERLSYAAKVNFMNAGSATMSVEGIEAIRGKPTYHTIFNVHGRVLFFHVDDHYESWF